MKSMIVLSALVALSTAGYAPIAYTGLNPLALGYSSYAPSLYSNNILAAHPGLYNVPAIYNTPTIVAAPAPAVVAARTVVAAPAVVATSAVDGVKSQYHAQDELGQASYGHAEPTQSHNAVQDAHGNKVGSFSYVAPDGRVLRTDYVADALGYRVESNALPVGPGAGPAAVVDTPEVVAARAAHLALHARAKRSLVAVGHTPASTAPLTTVVAAPAVAYSNILPSPIAYSSLISHGSPVAYSNVVAHGSPVAYSNVVAHGSPVAYSNVVAHGSPVAYSNVVAQPIATPLAYNAAVAPASLLREATLTTVVNNPGHAVSYRVD